MLIGSTGPMLFTYTAVSITVGRTETQRKTPSFQAFGRGPEPERKNDYSHSFIEL